MGNCEGALNPQPRPCGQAFDRVQDLEARWGPIIRAIQAAEEIERFRHRPGCWRELDDQLTLALGQCKIEFWKICDFDRLIRICPFDPAWEAFDWKQQTVTERVQALEVQVKELQAKVQTHK